MTHVLHQYPFTPYDELPINDFTSFEALPIPDAILPVGMTNEFRHRVGTRPLDVAQWLPSDAETEPTIAMKRELLKARRSEVVGLLEGGEDAAGEAAQLVADFVGRKLQ